MPLLRIQGQEPIDRSIDAKAIKGLGGRQGIRRLDAPSELDQGDGEIGRRTRYKIPWLIEVCESPGSSTPGTHEKDIRFNSIPAH